MDFFKKKHRDGFNECTCVLFGCGIGRFTFARWWIKDVDIPIGFVLYGRLLFARQGRQTKATGVNVKLAQGGRGLILHTEGEMQ